jgi:hypothetical protein
VPDPEAEGVLLAMEEAEPLALLMPDEAAAEPEAAAEAVGIEERVTPAALQRSTETWVISVVCVSIPIDRYRGECVETYWPSHQQSIAQARTTRGTSGWSRGRWCTGTLCRRASSRSPGRQRRSKEAEVLVRMWCK